MSKVLDQSKIEVSSSIITDFGAKKFMKIWSTSKTPKMTWIEWIKNPRRVPSPTKLASREITAVAAESIMHVNKISEEFSNIVKLCLRFNSSSQNKNSNSKMNEELSNRKSNKIDFEELEEDDASTSEDENEENIVHPQSTADTCKSGLPVEASSSQLWIFLVCQLTTC